MGMMRSAKKSRVWNRSLVRSASIIHTSDGWPTAARENEIRVESPDHSVLQFQIRGVPRVMVVVRPLPGSIR